MRLRKEKNIITTTYLLSSKPPSYHHNKNASMDIPPSAKAKNIYLSRVLQKNLGSQRITIDQNNLRENMNNFQSSIQSILANEESRQRAKNYVLNMRSKKGQFSPYPIQSEPRNKNIYSNTNYDGFYDPKKKNNYEIKESIFRTNNHSTKEIVAVKQKNINDKQYYYNNFGNITP